MFGVAGWALAVRVIGPRRDVRLSAANWGHRAQRRVRRSTVSAGGALAIVVVIVLLLPNSTLPVPSGGRADLPAGVHGLQGAHSTAASLALSLAQKSLQEGNGPAAGSEMSCASADSSTTTCAPTSPPPPSAPSFPVELTPSPRYGAAVAAFENTTVVPARYDGRHSAFWSS